MLDERLEYQQYTYDPQELHHVCRLKYRGLIKPTSKGKGEEKEKGPSFSGLRRAMTIVARYYLFDVFGDEPDRKERVKDTMDALRRWVGDLSHADEEKEGKYSLFFSDWLPNYINLCLKMEYRDNDEILANLDKALVALKKEEYPHFNRSQADVASWNVNTTHTITYEDIVYCANYAGCLKRYYLVCKDGLSENIKRLHISNRGEEHIMPVKGSFADLLLKALAVFLLAGEGEMTKREFRLINKTDLENWIINKQLNNSYISEFMYHDQQVFVCQKIDANQTELKVLPEFLKAYDLQLIEEEGHGEAIDSFMAEHPGYVFYRDEGACRYLSKNLKYDPL